MARTKCPYCRLMIGGARPESHFRHCPGKRRAIRQAEALKMQAVPVAEELKVIEPKPYKIGGKKK